MPAQLGVSTTWAQGARAPGFTAVRSMMTDSGGISPTHWVKGGVIGAAIFGIIGAGTAMQLSESRSVGVALLGFVPGAMIGFPIGALIGGLFPKH